MEKLLDIIKELSLKDKKTLSQKALKVCEESGELAKSVLPFESAHGTTHRFVDKEKILEEVSDTILSAISIAYELEFTDEEIKEMIYKKSMKWMGIQRKEEGLEYPVPYETHITVKTDDIENFRTVCSEIGVKPIVLDLQNNGESVMTDVMTSSKHMGDNRSAYDESSRIKDHLKNFGFEVVRTKIETVPWHPAAPITNGDKMPDDCYFEAHIGCVITPNQKDTLLEVSNKYGAHLSRNYFKKLSNGKFVNMITLRSYDDVFSDFELKLESLKEDLDSINIEYEKVITEFSIYDTKVSHDFKWTS